MSHLKQHYPGEYQQLLRLEADRKEEECREAEPPKRKQPTLQSTLLRTTAYDNANPKVQHLNNLLIRLICAAALPFNLLELQPFIDFVAELDPRY